MPKNCDRTEEEIEETPSWPPKRYLPFTDFDEFIAPTYGGPTEIGTGFSSLQLTLDTTYSNWLMFDALRVSSRV